MALRSRQRSSPPRLCCSRQAHVHALRPRTLHYSGPLTWALPRQKVQGVMPASNSVIDMLLRATNKETGEGLSDMQVAAQVGVAGRGPGAH